MFSQVYHESTGIAGLNYIALAIGVTCATQCNAHLMDKVYMYFKKRNGGIGLPEFRIRTSVPSHFLADSEWCL